MADAALIPAGALGAGQLSLSFRQPDGSLQCVIDIPRLDVEAGGRVGITGPSGAGKTSLLHALAGIHPLDAGSVRWGETDITRLGDTSRDRWRREHVGIVFQDFHLFDGLSVLGNVTLPASFGRPGDARATRRRAESLLARVGAPDARRAVATLSRGERQRVAIARALLLEPSILIADEPTANLDPQNAESVAELLLEISVEYGATLIAVSHDARLLSRLTSVYRLDQGRLGAMDPGQGAP